MRRRGEGDLKLGEAGPCGKQGLVPEVAPHSRSRVLKILQEKRIWPLRTKAKVGFHYHCHYHCRLQPTTWHGSLVSLCHTSTPRSRRRAARSCSCTDRTLRASYPQSGATTILCRRLGFLLQRLWTLSTWIRASGLGDRGPKHLDRCRRRRRRCRHCSRARRRCRYSSDRLPVVVVLQGRSSLA